MNWALKSPAFGDIVRVKNGSFYHYGIYATDTEIIQFGLIPSRRAEIKDADIEVCVTDVEGFLDGGIIEVGECEEDDIAKKRSPEAVVTYARERIGVKGYNIIHNNCEHFAFDCLLGERRCQQEAVVREHFRRLMAEKFGSKS